MEFPFFASFTDRSAGSGTSCDLTRNNMQYIDTVRKIIEDYREVRWVEKALKATDRD